MCNYLTVSVGQGSGIGLAGSSFQVVTGCYQGVGQGWVLIQRLNWERIFFQTQVGKIEFLEDCRPLSVSCHVSLSNTAGCFIKTRNPNTQQKQSTNQMKVRALQNVIAKGSDLLRAVREAKLSTVPSLWCSEFPCTVLPINTHGDPIFLSP